MTYQYQVLATASPRRFRHYRLPDRRHRPQWQPKCLSIQPEGRYRCAPGLQQPRRPAQRSGFLYHFLPVQSGLPSPRERRCPKESHTVCLRLEQPRSPPPGRPPLQDPVCRSVAGGDQLTVETTYTYEPVYDGLHTMTEPRGNDPSYVPPNGGPIPRPATRPSTLTTTRKRPISPAWARSWGSAPPRRRNCSPRRASRWASAISMATARRTASRAT